MRLKTTACQEFPMATGNDTITLQVLGREITVLECLYEQGKAFMELLGRWLLLVRIERSMFVKQGHCIACRYPIVSISTFVMSREKTYGPAPPG